MTKEKETRDRLDELLTGQIGQWRDHWLDTLPPVTQPHAFSSGFRRRMERLLRRAEAYPCGRPRLRLALLLAALLAAMVMMLAFARLYGFSLAGPSGILPGLDPAGADALVGAPHGGEDTVTLTVNFESYGDFFEIGRDLIAATDPMLENRLRLERCVPEGSLYTYTFRTDTPVEKLYVAPPILYFPREIEPVTTALHEESAFFSAEIARLTEQETGTEAELLVRGEREWLPRTLTLTIGGQSWENTSSEAAFDEELYFTDGYFTFVLPFSAEELASRLDEARLTVTEVLCRAQVDDGNMQSPIALTVIHDVED